MLNQHEEPISKHHGYRNSNVFLLVAQLLCTRSKRLAVSTCLSAHSKKADIATKLVAPVPADADGEGTAVEEELQALDGAHLFPFFALREL